MTTLRAILFAGLLFASACHLTSGEQLPSSMALYRSVGSATSVVVASLTAVVAPHTVDSAKDSDITSIDLAPTTECTFDVEMTLKGPPEKQITATLPEVCALYYGDHVRYTVGSRVVLALVLRNGVLQPCDPTRPVLFIGSAKLERPAGSPLNDVIDLLVLSLKDKSLAPQNLYVLKDVVNKLVADNVAPLSTDSDPQTADYALFCLASNQVVTAIPSITEFAVAHPEPVGVPLCVAGISRYRVSAAIPYLNELLFSGSQFIRLNAMMALRADSDGSSVPYLLVAMSDPESQGYVAFAAYQRLHEIIPSLGPSDSEPYFDKHCKAEAEEVYDWWTAELAGRHSVVVSSDSRNETRSKGTDYSQLFDPQASNRIRAISRLEGRWSPGCAPYLIVGLLDPDTDIALRAYKLLHDHFRLLPVFSSPPQYPSGRQQAICAAIGQWQAYLRHTPN